MIDNKKDKDEKIPELLLNQNILGKWSAFFINRYRVVFLIILAIIIIGISSYFELPRELNPEIIFPFGNVVTVYNGAAPDEVETLITNKIENKLEDLEEVKSMTSYSNFGYSMVWMEFEQGTDVDGKIEEMRDKLASIETELPEGAETPIIDSIKTNNTPIMVVNISGDYDLIELTDIAEDLKDRLELESDVLEALIIGGIEREIKIVINPQKLAVYGISLDQIKNIIATSNVNFPGGNIVLDDKNYNIRTVGQLENIKQLENLVIVYQDSGPLYLKDIATIIDGYKDTKSYSRLSVNMDSKEPIMKRSISISIKKKEDSDIIRTSSLIHEIIEVERGISYPDDLEVQISGDTAKFVRNSLGAVTSNALSGLFLVLIVLFLFIGFTEAVIVSTVIPLSILLALWMMKLNNMTFNTITLFSLVLAVGMLVDNAIVIMENIDRLRFKGLDAVTAASVGTNQIAPAVSAATLTTLAAFFPILLTPGIMGEYIKSIPLTVMFTLIGSFFVAMTITPAFCSILLKKHRSQIIVEHKNIKTIFKKIFSILFIVILALAAFAEDGKIGLLSIIFAIIFGLMMAAKQFIKQKKFEDGFIIRNYSKILYKIIQKKKLRWTVVISVFSIFLTSIALPILNILKVEMFAQSDFDRIYIDIETPNGTTIEITDKISKEIEKLMFEYDEIAGFVANIGITGADSFSSISDNAGDPNIGRIILDLIPEENRDITSMDLAAQIRGKLKNITGAKINIVEAENGPPSEAPIAIDIMGEDLSKVEIVASDFEEMLRNIPGTRDVTSTVSEGDPELQIRIDKERAARYGLNDMSIAMSIRNAVNGLKATTYRVNQEEIDVIIKTSESKLNKKTDIERLYFYNSKGQTIEFNQVARLIETKGYTTIVHEEMKRRVKVTSQLKDGIVAADVSKIFDEKIANYNLPKGLTTTQGGEIGDIQETFLDMFINMIIAAILVYLILAVQFNSLSQPFIILFTVPMALIGVMYGLLLMGHNFGFVSFVGVVALVGIAVNDAIVLVDYINYLRKNGYELYDAVRETGITRFIPVMATTITTAGGILPITLKQEFFAPLGYALIFGLTVATVLTLVVVPVMYTMLEEGKLKKERKRAIKQNKLEA